jgi:membrane fusion protein, multidrug efflux system
MRLRTLCLLLVAPLLLVACGKDNAAKTPPQMPPTEVTIYETKAENVPLYLEFVGQTSGLKDIAIRARVEGFLEGIQFKEGTEVKKGDLLYELESQPFEEKVATRMSAVAEAKTMLAKATGDLGRIKPLAEIDAVSQSDLDEAVAAEEAALAGLDAAEANLRAAKIELSYTRIKSPIDGLIGKTAAKVGDFVGRDPNPIILNTVSQIDTILVTYFITETQYLAIARWLAETEPQQQLDEKASLELILVDGSVYEQQGATDFVDREVNPTTGAMLVQASFPNPQKLLRPGQFAKVRIRVKVVKDGILIPQRCVMELQGLHNVFVVDANQKVTTREIKTGPKVGSYWLISEGLEVGEKVIFEGLQKVKPGATVKPVPVDISSTNLKKK